MRLRQPLFKVGIIAFMAALLALTTATAFASPSAQDGERRGIFGEVVRVDGDTIVVRSGDDTVRIQRSPDTRFAVRGKGQGSPNIQPGDEPAPDCREARPNPGAAQRGHHEAGRKPGTRSD